MMGALPVSTGTGGAPIVAMGMQHPSADELRVR